MNLSRLLSRNDVSLALSLLVPSQDLTLLLAPEAAASVSCLSLPFWALVDGPSLGGLLAGIVRKVCRREVFNGMCVRTAQNKTKVVTSDHESHRHSLLRKTWFAERV